ncbi:MAG TPA: amidohydrolase family protein [Chloroflexota bacterium]|nr:amidohydrolase family protein [Chloroflexota bacterium]
MAVKIDCDSHFLPFDAFDDVDPKFLGRRPHFIEDGAGRSVVIYKDRAEHVPSFMWNYPTCLVMGRRHPGTSDADVRAADLKKIGFDRQVLVPNNAPYAYDVDPELGASVCAAYNNAVARALKRHPEFIGLAVMPMQDVSLAIKELDRAILELGLHAPQIGTAINDRNLDEFEFWPFYQRVEELNVPLIVHCSHLAITAGAHRYQRYRFGNALQFPAESSLAVGSLICGGVLDAFPRLRVGVLEAGAGFVPYLFDRLDEVSVEEPDYTKIRNRRLASEYLENFWFSFNIKAESKSMAFLVERLGADRLLISSDYPHGLAGSGMNTIQFLESLGSISAEDKDKLMGLNAVQLFNLSL